MPRLRPIVQQKLADPAAERVRQSVAGAIGEIQQAPAMALVVLRDVSLANGIEVEVAHGLGRAPLFVAIGPTRGAAATGRIGELRGTHSSGTPIDGTKVVCLQAVGFGATVSVDVAVM